MSNDDFKIEDGIPIPNRLGMFNVWGPRLMLLSIGQSFYVSYNRKDPKKLDSIRNVSSKTGLKHNRKFTCRTDRDGDRVILGIRVWRVR